MGVAKVARVLVVLLVASQWAWFSFAGECFSHHRYWLWNRKEKGLIWWWGVVGDRFYEMIDDTRTETRIQVRRLRDEGDELEHEWRVSVPDGVVVLKACGSGERAWYYLAGPGEDERRLAELSADGKWRWVPWPSGENEWYECVGWEGVLVSGRKGVWHWDGTRWEEVYHAPEGWEVGSAVTSADGRWMGVVLGDARDSRRYRTLLVEMGTGKATEVQGIDVVAGDELVGVVGGDSPELVVRSLDHSCDEKVETECGRWVKYCVILSRKKPNGELVCWEKSPAPRWVWNDGRVWVMDLDLEKGVWWVERIEPVAGGGSGGE